MTSNDERIGKLQLRFLRKHGLKPRHSVLDVGCGTLRGGRHIIEYLNTDNYVGIEKDKSRLAVARRVARCYPNKSPTIHETATYSIPGQRQFDVALAHSVFTHLTPRQIVECLTAVLPRVATLYATWNRADIIDLGQDHKTRTNEQHKTRYPFIVLHGLAMVVGGVAKDHGWMGHPGGQEWLSIRKS